MRIITLSCLTLALSGCASQETDVHLKGSQEINETLTSLEWFCPGCADSAKVITETLVVQCERAYDVNTVRWVVSESNIFAAYMAVMSVNPKMPEVNKKALIATVECDDRAWTKAFVTYTRSPQYQALSASLKD